MAEHTKGPECWCHPTAYTLCTECDGDGCWRCEGQAPWPGLLIASEYEKSDETTPILTVHNDPQELAPSWVIREAIVAMQQDLSEGE